MTKKQLLAVVFAAFFTNSAFAHNVHLHSTLPSVSVANDGELIAAGSAIHYKPWNSSRLTGKVRTVFHIAGRSAAKEKNEALVNAIKAAGFDRHHYQTTTIINADDAIVGTGMFVKSSAEKGKLANAHSQVVLDQKSAVKKAWNLKGKESFVAILDKQGNVQFAAEGKLSAADVQRAIQLISQLITQ